MNQQIEIILEWHAAVNAGDPGRAVTLAHADVEMGGPRGTVRGVETLRLWVEQARIQLQPQRIFHRDDRAVVEQVATWRIPESGQATEPDTVASAFVVRDGHIQSIFRYPDLATALDNAGLSSDNEVGNHIPS